MHWEIEAIISAADQPRYERHLINSRWKPYLIINLNRLTQANL
jgi:hypothetical protein